MIVRVIVVDFLTRPCTCTSFAEDWRFCGYGCYCAVDFPIYAGSYNAAGSVCCGVTLSENCFSELPFGCCPYTY